MATKELQGSAGVASIPESTFKIATAPKDIVGDLTGEAVEGERSKVVQAAGPISGDRVRTSVPEGKVSEEGSLDIT